MQAVLCTAQSPALAVVDREAQFAFPNMAERHEVTDRIFGPYAAAMDSLWHEKRARGEPFPRPRPLGGEADAVAIDSRGRLLTIEIKPGTAVSTTTWSPTQASVYAELFREWVARAGPAAVANVHEMLEQRLALGLTADLRHREPVDVVPVVAIGLPIKSRVLQSRMRDVQGALRRGGIGFADLEVWEVSRDGSYAPAPWWPPESGVGTP